MNITEKLDSCLKLIRIGNRKLDRLESWYCAEKAAEIADVEVFNNPLDDSARPYPDYKRLENDIRAALKPEYIIVTKRADLVKWLETRGIAGEIKQEITRWEVESKVIVGDTLLDPELCAYAARVGYIKFIDDKISLTWYQVLRMRKPGE